MKIPNLSSKNIVLLLLAIMVLVVIQLNISTLNSGDFTHTSTTLNGDNIELVNIEGLSKTTHEDNTGGGDGYITTSNAFDSSNSTFAREDINAGSQHYTAFGQTFDEIYINYVAVRYCRYIDNTGTRTGTTILQYYNGASWVDIQTLESLGNSDNCDERTYEVTPNVNAQGIRLYFNQTNTGSAGDTARYKVHDFVLGSQYETSGEIEQTSATTTSEIYNSFSLTYDKTLNGGTITPYLVYDSTDYEFTDDSLSLEVPSGSDIKVKFVFSGSTSATPQLNNDITLSGSYSSSESSNSALSVTDIPYQTLTNLIAGDSKGDVNPSDFSLSKIKNTLIHYFNQLKLFFTGGEK